MDAALLSRIQFGLTIGFHYIFPPLTIGLAWLIVWMMTKYLKTGKEIYKVMSKFWTRLFLLSFAIGVATGITMEFQFGTNWSIYSKFVGDIFGAPLAAEGIFSFFLESSFLALMVFGENKISPKMHWFSALMVAVGSTLSGFWIIAANSWQQTPSGYVLVNGRAEMENFLEVLFNPSTLERFFHVIDGAIITGSFFMFGISAFYLLKKKHIEVAKRSFKLALIAAFVSSSIQLVFGHFSALKVEETQPVKLAAYEGLFETQKNAPLSVFGIPDVEAKEVKLEIAIPGLLSFMIGHSFDREIKGLNHFPEDEWPPVLPVFATYHIMIGLGMYFIGLTALGLLLLYRKQLFDNTIYLKLALFSIPLPFICNEAGWFAAEMGRQPWIVYKLLRTSEAFSPVVPAGQILFSIIMFIFIYSFLFYLWIFLLKKKIHQGPDSLKDVN